MKVPTVFNSIVTQEEWSKLPNEIGHKISNFVQKRFEDNEKISNEHQSCIEKLENEGKLLQSKLKIATETIAEHEKQLSQLTTELNKLHSQCNSFEAETAEYRDQRNSAVSERDEYMTMLQRKTAELERFQIDISNLNKKLEVAVNEKCEALSLVDEIASIKVAMKDGEKKMEQERTLFKSQIESLTDQLNQKTQDAFNVRHDIQLEIKLTETIQELAVASEQIKSLTELNNNLISKNEELSQEILNHHKTEVKLNESYVDEVEAKTKMADTYKEMYEESQELINALKETVSEVQHSLKTATERCGELETKYKELELAHEEIISRKNQYIDVLKKELDTANKLIESNKIAQLDSDIGGISSRTSFKIIKPGLSFSELYAQYTSISEQCTNKEEECIRLNNYISRLVHEIEEKGPLIKKLREEYSNSLDVNNQLKIINDQLQNEMEHLRELNAKCKKSEEIVRYENDKMKKEIADLSRQVVHLLVEVEHLRIEPSSISTDKNRSDADITTKTLITFSDISELQDTNKKLLSLVREFKEREEDEDFMNPPAVANLKMKLNDLRKNETEMLEEKDTQIKMMAILQNQRDMYKNLYTQVIKAQGKDTSTHLESILSSNNEGNNTLTDTELRYEEKVKSLENQLEKHNKLLEQIKEENETYCKEKSINEQILIEQLDNMRGEIKELTRLNCKLTSHAENNGEKLKVMQNNIEIYKKQISALEKQNKIYSDVIIKHEQTATYLRDETMKCQTMLSKEEVRVANLQKENMLLNDAKQRLTKEIETLKQDTHQQHLISSNIKLIKASMERTDAESKLKLESKLDEVHRECAALRRRLQEEQDHFKQLIDRLEKQTKTAQRRMEEEKEQADKLRKEVAEMREEIIHKTSQIEELGKKLKMGLFAIPDKNVEMKKFREIEQHLADAQSEIKSLQANLKTHKETSDKYLNISQSAEKKVKDLIERNESLLAEIEKQKGINKEWQEKCSELEGKLSIQLDDKDISNANFKNKSELQEELNIKNMDLQTARQQLENARLEKKSLIEQLKAVEDKYGREVTLHSADLQTLATTKEELQKTLDRLKTLERENQQGLKILDECKLDWKEQEKCFQKEREDLESRFKDIEAQNSLLHDQIQVFHTQLNILQTQATEHQNQSYNKSFSEDDTGSPEQLLKIIKHLRQEKVLAISKTNIIEAEYTRLKSQFDILSKQLEEAKQALKSEQEKIEVSVVPAAKHAEILTKLETLNALTDSNRSLRQERDNLLLQIKEFKENIEVNKTEIIPLQEKNKDLTSKVEQLQSENVSLRAECTRWRQRANMLIEKTNRTNPDDWKKLQTERETLAKQLTVERANTTKLNDEINNLKQDKIKLEDAVKNLELQINNETEEITKLRDKLNNLQSQIVQLTNMIDQQSTEVLKLKEENRILTEDTAGKDVTITELKNNLTQVRKIAKKYKIQCEDQTKELDILKQQTTQNENSETANAERQEQMLTEQRSQLEEQLSQLESHYKETVESLNQQITSCTEQIDNFKKEIEGLKQTGMEKEERFKTLFKNAKDRIVSLTEQNNNLKEELNKQGTTSSSSVDTVEQSVDNNQRITELLEKITILEKEKEEVFTERQQEREQVSADIESLNLKINQLQRQLGLQQGAKPSTSTSCSSEKPSSDRPTADIKPMAGHSTTTQAQSISIQPWRSGGEPLLASIRPMSAQLRTVAVLPTSQSPSAVMIPPQQVHTTGSSNNVEQLSSSPTSSHTDYVPSTSSMGSTLGVRQVLVPPTQSSQDTEDEENSTQMQAVQQTQAIALVLPRVDAPSGSPTQEQGTSGSSNTVTTTQAGHKRQRDVNTDCPLIEQAQQLNKRARLQTGTVSDSDTEVEYQVPTSSQRDQDDDNVILVESDDEGGPDEGEGADDEQEEPVTEGYNAEAMDQDNYEEADYQEVEVQEGTGNEAEVIDDSGQIPNQSEICIQETVEESSEQPQSEAISSGTDGAERNMPTLSVESSPQEGGGEEEQTSGLVSQENLPENILNEDQNDPPEESNSSECTVTPNVAGTSTDGNEKLKQKREEGDNGVSSEGEKLPVTEENVEEGREAEASPSTNSRRNLRGPNSSRRSSRIIPRGIASMRMSPSPIVWERPLHQQRHQDRGRNSMSPNYQSRGIVRRGRGRLQRHFSGRF